MQITKRAFEKRQLTLMMILLLFIGGISTYQSMPRAEDPGYIVRSAQVQTMMSGASPERMEQLVTDKIEKVIQEMPEIDYIESTSKTGVSVITVNILESYTNMRPIWDSLRRKVEIAERDLPDTASIPFVNDEYGDVFGIVFSITGEGFNYADLKDIADDVRDELLMLDLVAKVEIHGAQDERVFIDYSNAKLAELSLSPDQLAQILSKRNVINSGGIIHTSRESIAVEPTGSFESVEELQRTLIEIPDSYQIVPLESLAHVYRGYIDPPTSVMHSSGMPSLGMAISMREGGNIVALGEEVNWVLNKLQANYPIGIEFQLIADQPRVVTQKIDDFIGNLLQAITIVCLVMLVFLGVRTGLIVASLIPVAVVISLLVMSTLHIGLDQVSLAALIIALGMLVDNSIVVSESALVQMKAGKKPLQAAIDSANELKIPLLISSLTTAAAFLPIFLGESSTAEYTSSIFKVVTITLLCSWVVALTMIPIFCATFLKMKKESDQDENPFENSPFYKKYRQLLKVILTRPYKTLFAVGVVFALSLGGMAFIPTIFFPPNDAAMFTGEIELPVGSPLRRTEEVINRMDAFIKEELIVNEERSKGITGWATYIGNGGPRYRLQHSPEPPSPYYSFSLFNVTSYPDVSGLIDRLERYLFDTFPDVKTKIRPLENGSPVNNPIEVRLSGKNPDKLFQLVDIVKARLEPIQGTKNIVDDWGLRAKKIVIDVDEARAQRAGVTNADVARSLEAALSGVALTEYREDDKLIPIVLRSVAAKDSEQIASESFNVYAQRTGKSVPIRQVADVQVAWEPAQILRRDRLRTVTVSTALDRGYTATEINTQIVPWLEEESKSWPIGYRWELGGEDEKSSMANAAIKAKLPLAGLIILVLLMAQFNNIRKTAIVLVTIPLAFIGVSFGLLLTGSYFGFMTLLGLISLAGIVINNAIVLIDRIQIEIEQNGLEPRDAIVMAAQRRFRPILLTTVTTVAGLLPLWFGGGLMWEPMAIAIIFGLLVATGLTLGVVPLLYALFFRVKY